MKHIWLIITSLLLALTAGGAVQSRQAKTIDRRDDPIILKASRLPALLGVKPALLSMMAFRNGAWTAIPFQIDQVKPDGQYAFTAGKNAGPDPDPNLDANDEIALMARDLGDRAGAWPEDALAGEEIEVTDPINNAQGWAYLFSFSANPPLSKTDYIRLEIDEKNKRRSGRGEEVIIGAPLDRIYPDLISYVDPKTGKSSPDVLDRLKIRGELYFPGGAKVPLDIDSMIKCNDTGYIDGPIRVLHQTWGFMEVASAQLKGIGFSTLTYYTNFMIVPVSIEIGSTTPTWMRKILPNGRIKGYMDFNKNVFSSYVVSLANPYNPDVALDGKTSLAEKNLDRKKEINWIAGYGPQGGLVVRLVLSPKSAKRTKVTTYFLDDQNAKDPPENDPGVSAAGFEITGRDKDLGDLANNEVFYIYAYVKHDLNAENLHSQLDILDHPLEARVVDLQIKAR